MRRRDNYEVGEQATLATRIDPRLKSWLAREADAHGRSLAAEVVSRLEASRNFDQHNDVAFGGPRQAAFFRALAAEVIARFGLDYSDWPWPDNPFTFGAVRQYMIGYLERIEIRSPDGAELMQLVAYVIAADDRNGIAFAKAEIERKAEIFPELCADLLAKLDEAAAQTSDKDSSKED